MLPAFAAGLEPARGQGHDMPFAIMRLTDRAADRIRDIISRSDTPIAGLRVGVKKGGCAGMEYTMEYAAAAEKGDEVIDDKGVRVLVDPKAVLFLLGTEMDYVTERLSSRFVFNNPNQTSACGCGESVEIVAARPEALAGPAH
jgi:iron-sulfur cluster assembly protein